MDDHIDNVKKAISGDKVCFTELMEERKDMLYRTAFLYVKNEHDALEIVDITVYKAYLSIKKLRNPEFFHTWLMRILINASMDMLRERKRVILLNGQCDDQYSDDEDSSGRIDLYNAVDKLQDKYKTVIILKYYNALKISEIAEIMACSESNVKNYVHKALEKLRYDICEEGGRSNGRL